MKRIPLFLSALLLAGYIADAQGVQGTLVNGPTPNSIRVRIKNNTAAPLVGDLVSLRFSVRITDQGANNPTITTTSLMATPGSITFPPAYTSGGFRYYDVSAAMNGGNPVNIPVGGELDAFNIAFGNGSGVSNVQLVAFPVTGPGSAGPNDATEFYVAMNSGDVTDNVNRFYDNGVNSFGLSNTPGQSLVGLTGIVLPVSYTHIEASKSNNSAVITWGTATEKNNAGFEIERSKDGKAFSKIGYQRSLAVNGNSSSNLEYSYTDNKTLSGINYYRLKQVDVDGNSRYSQVVSVIIDQAGSIKTFPNPAVNKITVEGAGVQSIEVYTIAGQKLNVPVAYGTVSHEVNTAALASGNYTLRITTASGVTNQKIVVQH
jgi:hypothetical protein